MVRVDMKEVITASQQLSSQADQVTELMDQVGTAMRRVPQSVGFVGKAQKAMNRYVKSVHSETTSALTSDLNGLIDEFDRLIRAFKTGVDSSDKAIIDTDYLQTELSKLRKLQNDFEQGITTGNKGCTQADGLADVTRLSQKDSGTVKTAGNLISHVQQNLSDFNMKKPTTLIKDITKGSAQIAGNIALSAESSSSRVFMENLKYTKVTPIKGTTKKRTSLSNMNSKSSKLEGLIDAIEGARTRGDILISSAKAGWETLDAIKKFFAHTGYHKAVSLLYSKTGYKTFRQVRGDIKQTNWYKDIDHADDLWSGSALGSKLSPYLEDKEFELFKGKAVAKVPVVGSLIDGFLTYSERVKQYGQWQAIRDGFAHATITGVTTAIGSAIGTFIPVPGLGTALGAAAGMILGSLLTKLYDAQVHKKTMAIKEKGWQKFGYEINPLVGN